METGKHLRNRVKIILFLLIAIGFARCSDKPDHNISTSEALLNGSQYLKDQFFVVFPELREKPIKWFDSIPERKIQESIDPEEFVMNALPGEFYVFQLGVFATVEDVKDIQIEFSDLAGKRGNKIEAAKMTCFNLEGIDFRGRPFKKEMSVPAGRVKALWLGIDLDSVPAGNYKGSVSVISNGVEKSVPLLLKVSGDAVANHGYNEGSHMARLNWLNSTAGIDNEPTKDFVPVSIEKNRISILGRTLTIAENGLPASIVSYFSPSNETLVENAHSIVSKPFRFVIVKENGEIVRLTPDKINFIAPNPSRVEWKVNNSSEDFDLELNGVMEFDGFVDYSLRLSAKNPVKIKNIRLEIPFEEDHAEYMMGLGHEGGFRTPEWKWKWDLTKNQDMLWVGAVNGGLRIKWKAENYIRPLINVYYAFGPLKLPPSWGNEGRGGVDAIKKGGDVVVTAYSGSREMNAGDNLHFNFELLITPFRVIDRKNKYEDRYFHGGGTNTSVKVEAAKKAGANVINIHHAEDIYPFINYPYLDANVNEIKALAENAHKENIRLKLYYTTRELTKNLPEFWAIYSLDGEVIYPGPGNKSQTVINPDGPNEWLVKNLREKYIPAWFNPIMEGKFKGENDLSVLTTPDSRLNNFYVAGLDWMVQNLGIDGVYIDDSALDRYTLQRSRKIIDRHRPEGRMDLHSWNHFNKWAGFTNCLNLYMDLLPYFDLIWIGEGRDYNRSPDHWLIEVSGIPFGLTGQMLEGGGNPWRGMVYGITNRAGYLGNSPEGIWKFWDKYKMTDKKMIGYWEENCPVKSGNDNIKASVYKGTDVSIISVANWSEKDQKNLLSINWKKLGMDPGNVDILIPAVDEFQVEEKPGSLSDLEIPAKKGFLLVIQNRNDLSIQ